jgi:hypothetical protein
MERNQASSRTTRIRGREIRRSRAALAAIAILGLATAVIVPLAWPGGSTSQPTRPAGSHGAAAPALAMASFAGYPGTVPVAGAPRLEVNAIASAHGQRLAVGSADGSPAIWRQRPGGGWTLVTTPEALPARSGPAALTSVAYGPAGWLAVGVPGPVVLSSADGATWRPAAGKIAADLGKISVVSATAGPRGYVILGKLAVSGGGCVADVWWSPNMTSWTRAHDVNGTSGSSQTLAVAALTHGFVSVGSHNGRPAAWTTTDGTTWRTIDLPAPGDAQLNQIAVIGSRVVATGGSDGQGAGTPAFAVSSPDGGATWRQESLQLPAPGTVITALTAGSRGWVAAGRYVTPGGQRVVMWTLPAAGKAWTQMHVSGITGPGTARTREITALAGTEDVVTGIGPVDPAASRQAAIVTLPER